MGDELQWDLFIDIETTGLSCSNEIILINFQDGIEGSHEMLLSWETSEKGMLNELILRIGRVPSIYKRHLHCIGFNSLKFDIPFLFYRCIYHKILSPEELYRILFKDFWHYDLLQILLSKNNFQYFNWNKVLNAYGYPETKGKGRDIPNWYKNRDYTKIKTYAKSEFVPMSKIYKRIKAGDLRI